MPERSDGACQRGGSASGLIKHMRMSSLVEGGAAGPVAPDSRVRNRQTLTQTFNAGAGAVLWHLRDNVQSDDAARKLPNFLQEMTRVGWLKAAPTASDVGSVPLSPTPQSQRNKTG